MLFMFNAKYNLVNSVKKKNFEKNFKNCSIKIDKFGFIDHKLTNIPLKKISILI